MATNKSSEIEYCARKVEKMTDTSTVSRRTQKYKLSDHSDINQKKATRAKSRTIVSDDTVLPQSSLNKAREKMKAISELTKDGEVLSVSKKEIENVAPPKKEPESVMPTKKDIIASTSPKKEILGAALSKREEDGFGLPKKEVQPIAVSKKDGESTVLKNRKLKIKTSSNSEKKFEDRLNPLKNEEIKSEVTTSEKSKIKDDKIKADRKENDNLMKLDLEKSREIMNSDVTSSADAKPKILRSHSPAVGANSKDHGWKPGDLAWGRVGQHPFWPCMISIDYPTGQYIKTKRVGRGLNSVQQSLHVQFFGDNGRHSWISTTCVIKYEGKEQFQKFANKVLLEMKKKDKRYSSAFIVKPTSKSRWENAIREAEESVPKTREDRIQFFQELFRKRKTSEKPDDQKIETEEIKIGAKLVKKKRSNTTSTDRKPSKQMKIEKEQISLKVEEKKKNDNAALSTNRRRKNSRDKIVKKEAGEFEQSDSNSQKKNTTFKSVSAEEFTIGIPPLWNSSKVRCNG